MGWRKISNSWNNVMLRLVDYGVPILILRDPFTQRPSLPFTMMVLSIVLEVISMVGHLSALVGGIDKGSAFQFLTTSAALYCGHSMVNSISAPDVRPPPMPPPPFQPNDPNSGNPS
jgi:hypothetical protein